MDGNNGCTMVRMYLTLPGPLKIDSPVNVSECMFYHKGHTSANERHTCVFQGRWCLLTLQDWDGIRTADRGRGWRLF